MATKLNKTMRNDILNSIVKSVFEKRTQEVKEQIRVACVNSLHTAYQDFYDAVKGLPPEWFKKAHTFDVTAGKDQVKTPCLNSVTMDSGCPSTNEYNADNTAVPNNIARYSSEVVIALDAANPAVVAAKELMDDYVALASGVRDVLHTSTTVESFRAKLPELGEMIDAAVGAYVPASTQLAVQCDVGAIMAKYTAKEIK